MEIKRPNGKIKAQKFGETFGTVMGCLGFILVGLLVFIFVGASFGVMAAGFLATLKALGWLP